MEMEAAYKELEELKAAMEKLVVGYREKLELSDSLKKAYNEQLAKFQEAKKEIDKQTTELHVKSEEISLAKKMYEDLKSSIHEKELAMRQLSSTNEQIRTSCREKVGELEGQNQALASQLDEVNAKVEHQEKKLSAYEQEVDGMRVLLSVSQKKCLEAEKKAQEAKELKKREELIEKAEQENAKIAERLKWKTEQFNYLEEAHEKLQGQFWASEKEWKSEKSRLVNEMCSLQSNLEAQTRVAEDLRFRLQMCNQALAHEESRRKLLEIQVLESRASYENALSECEEAKSKIENLTQRRDEEIAKARNIIASKEALLKEMDFQNVHLQHENQEMQTSLKELREAQIKEAGAASSLKILRQKLKSLEQVHRDCPANLKAKEVEWGLQMGKLENSLSECATKLVLRDREIQEMQLELYGCYSCMCQMKLENEEALIVQTVLMSKVSDVKLFLENIEAELVSQVVNRDRQIDLLTKELEARRSALLQAKAEAEHERQNANTLLMRAESSESIEKQYFMVQEELKKYKGLLEDSTLHLNYLKEDAFQKEHMLEENLRNVADALDRAKSTIEDKENQLKEVEFELQHMKLVAEQTSRSRLDAEVEIKALQEDCNKVRIELEDSMLAKLEIEELAEKQRRNIVRDLEERARKIEDLQKEISHLREEFLNQQLEAVADAKLGAIEAFNKEKEIFLKAANDKDKLLTSLRIELESLEQERAQKETEAMVTLEQERANFVQINEVKDMAIADLQKKILSQEQLTKSVETAMNLELADRQLEIDMLNESLKKITTATLLNIHEKEFKKMLSHEFEEELNDLKHRFDQEEKLVSDSKNCIKKLECEVKAEKVERERQRVQFEDEFERMQSNERTLTAEINALQSRVKKLQEEGLRMSVEREDMIARIVEMSDMIGKLSCNEDLIRNWESITEKAECREDMRGETVSAHQVKRKNYVSPLKNKTGSNLESRSPLKEQNGQLSELCPYLE